MGKSIISMAIFNSYVKLPEGKSHYIHLNHHKSQFSIAYPPGNSTRSVLLILGTIKTKGYPLIYGDFNGDFSWILMVIFNGDSNGVFFMDFNGDFHGDFSWILMVIFHGF